MEREEITRAEKRCEQIKRLKHGLLLPPQALRQLISYDIKQQIKWYWSEVSGKIKDMLLENGALLIPNELASHILGDIPLECKEDGYSYVRPGGSMEDGTEKMLVAFPDKSIYTQVVQKLRADNPFENEATEFVNHLSKDIITAHIYPADMNWATFMTANIGELIFDEDYGTILPEWKKYLDDSIAILKSYLDNREYCEVCQQFIDNALTYKKITTVLECHPLEAEMVATAPVSPADNGSKSIFILKAYTDKPFLDGPSYEPDKNTNDKVISLKFPIGTLFTTYSSSLAAAEEQIQEFVKSGTEDIYGFLIEERPLDFNCHSGDILSRRRYLKDGTLWQKREFSGVWGTGPSSGNYVAGNLFYGRPSAAIPFKVGDLVEVCYEDYVELAIVGALPYSLEEYEQMGLPEVAIYQNLDGNLRIGFDDGYDDVYLVFMCYKINKKGKYSYQYDHNHPAVVDVLPPSQPVPPKFAKKLREGLKKYCG